VSAALAAAAAMGLCGSLHCAAMCGPLVIAGCGNLPHPRRAVVGYFAARLFSYAVVGALLGHLGQHALCRLPFDRAGDLALAGVAGLATLRAVALWREPPAAPLIPLGRRSAGARSPVRDWLASLVPRRGLGLGLVTAVLPCGMLVPAWLLAASTGRALDGAVVMATFAVASAPGLLAPLAGTRLYDRARRALPRRAHAALWLGLALFVALRPLLMAAHHH
jgi:sulfite exporter TauE/SafE